MQTLDEYFGDNLKNIFFIYKNILQLKKQTVSEVVKFSPYAIIFIILISSNLNRFLIWEANYPLARLGWNKLRYYTDRVQS